MQIAAFQYYSYQRLDGYKDTTLNDKDEILVLLRKVLVPVLVKKHYASLKDDDIDAALKTGKIMRPVRRFDGGFYASPSLLVKSIKEGFERNEIFNKGDSTRIAKLLLKGKFEKLNEIIEKEVLDGENNDIFDFVKSLESEKSEKSENEENQGKSGGLLGFFSIR